MFIARSVSMERTLDNGYAFTYEPMPRLDDSAEQVYVKAYGSEAYYERYYHDHGDGTIHGSPPPQSRELRRNTPDVKFSHRPDHDVESIFWTLLYALITAQPKDGPHGIRSEMLEEAFRLFHKHAIPQEGEIEEDSRKHFFYWGKWSFENALHPGLKDLAPMLVDMALQICPEYAYLVPSPPEDHLHEAMRRILLQQIVSMQDDIPLDPDNPRPKDPPPPPGEQDTEQQKDVKRGFKRPCVDSEGGDHKKARISDSYAL